MTEVAIIPSQDHRGETACLLAYVDRLGHARKDIELAYTLKGAGTSSLDHLVSSVNDQLLEPDHSGSTPYPVYNSLLNTPAKPFKT